MKREGNKPKTPKYLSYRATENTSFFEELNVHTRSLFCISRVSHGFLVFKSGFLPRFLGVLYSHKRRMLVGVGWSSKGSVTATAAFDADAVNFSGEPEGE